MFHIYVQPCVLPAVAFGCISRSPSLESACSAGTLISLGATVADLRAARQLNQPGLSEHGAACIRHVVFNEDVRRKLSIMDWQVVTVTNAVPILTSDVPLIRYPGLADDDGLMLLPLSGDEFLAIFNRGGVDMIRSIEANICTGVFVELQPAQGSARLFILPADDQRSEKISVIRRWLAVTHSDPRWNRDDADADVRIFVLVHRMAARRLGFPNLYAALNDNGQCSLKDGLRDGTAWVLRPFLTVLLPLIAATNSRAEFQVISELRANCPLLSKERLAGQNVAQTLQRIKNDLDQLVRMFASSSASTIQEVLNFVRARELVRLDERFDEHLDGPPDDPGDSEQRTAEIAAVSAFLTCRCTELWGYRRYIENQSPFATQHGIKGAEFERVIVVLDDEEGDYNLYSYGKYFGLTPLSEKDQENIEQGVDSVISRTRRLLYVCCSRARQDLVVVLFAPDVNAATTAIAAKGLFPPDHTHGLSDLASVAAAITGA